VYKRREETKKLLQDAVSAEQVRMIRTNLESVMGNHSALFMVTSPTQEGENSIISSKLAISFVEQGKKVLLVDANIRKPSIHNWFQIQNDSGLSDVILNEDNILLHTKQTFVPGLVVLPTGPIPNNLTDIWVTSKIKKLVDHCGSEFEVVIFNAPPFLTVSDSHILANQCDGVILVVKENRTKKADLIQTKEILEMVNNQILGVIYQTA
jgi:protein-tyrosine kinase